MDNINENMSENGSENGSDNENVNSANKVIIDVPKIDTAKMTGIIKDITKAFKGVDRTTSLWICGRSESFGFRPSLVKKYLPSIMKEWVKHLEEGYVMITPIVFYGCDPKNTEKIIDKNPDDSSFMVFNHYNILISYMKTGKKGKSIIIERYEPASSRYQGNLDKRLKEMFSNTFKKYTKLPIEMKLVAEKGLQSQTKDKLYCGHHVVYWVIYRLKYGITKSIQMLKQNDASEKFAEFCKCIPDSKGTCLNLV